MTSDERPFRLAILLTGLLLITSASQAVLAQTEGHSSMEVDFGLLESDGSCNTSSSFFYFDGSESANRCLLIEFDAASNSRFNLSIWSDLSGEELEIIEMIVSPRTPSVLTIPLSMVIPLDMSYGEHRLDVIVEDWNPMPDESPKPMVIVDEHTLQIQRTESEIIGVFRFASEEIEVSQSAKLTGLMSHSIDEGTSIAVRPVLLQSSSVIATLEPYSIRPEVSVNKSVSFQLPDSLETGTHTLIVALQDNREDAAPLWFEEIEVTIKEPSGSVNVPFANWAITSFHGPSVLGTYPEDVVRVLLNMTNPGSYPASSDFWMNFATETDCFPVFIGETWIGAGESRTSTIQVAIPQVPHGTSLDAKLMSSGDCSGEAIHQLEQVTVFDWPVSVKSNVHINDAPVKLDGSSNIPISFSVANLENRATSNLEVEVALFAFGFPLGNWSGMLTFGANETETFHREISIPYCYDGDVDAAIKIRNVYGDVIDSFMTQNALRAYFIEGEFELHSSLVGSQTASLGMPIKIHTEIQAHSSNPSGCDLLIPLMTVFDPTEEDIPPETEISLIEVRVGELIYHNLETTISHMSGRYEVSQHLIKTYANNTPDNWMESELRFAEVEITSINPNFSIDCQDDVIPISFIHYLDVRCQINNLSPVPALIKIGIEIGDTTEWTPPLIIDPSDGESVNFSRHFSVGSENSASLHIRALWDGDWIDIDEMHVVHLPTENVLDGFEPFPYEVATTAPTFPRGGEPFAISFWAQGSTEWIDGTYEVKLWLDESKQGAVYSISPQKNDLQVGETRLVEIGLNEWPKNCGRLPYEVTARDSDGQILDTIKSYFNGCEIELVDFSLVNQIDIIRLPTECFARFVVENIGSRNYAPDNPTEQADITVIIDGVVEKSFTTVPPLDMGESTVLEVGIAKSGFREIRIILNGEGRFSELDRSNNGLGWSSSSGPILFENDSDFDGLPNTIEEAGYEIAIVDDRATLELFMGYISDPGNATRPNLNRRSVFPSPDHHDSDLDGLSDFLEWSIRSDPTNADTDGDGYGDLEEYRTPEQDPLIIETNVPIIHISEAIETRHPNESESKSGSFTRMHTREFTVEDRNLDPRTVTVTKVRPGKDPVTIPFLYLGSEGGRNYYSVSYEYSYLDELRTEVIVTAEDSYENKATFALHETVWDRAANTITSFATNSLLSQLKIDAPILGFLTGMVYGLKDIVDFAEGVINFILNFWELLGVVWGIIEDCAPRLQLPIRIPSECPIDISEIMDSMWSSFVSLSPYEGGTSSHTVFLMFTVWGFVTIGLLTSSLLSTAWGAAKASSATINTISGALSGTKDAVIGTLGKAVSSAKGVLGSGISKLGIPGAIKSMVSSSLVGIYSLGSSALSVVTGAVFLTILLVPTLTLKLILSFDDVLKLVWRGLAKDTAGKSLQTITDPRYYRIITHKNELMNEFPDNSFDEIIDAWATRYSPGDRTGQWYEFTVNKNTGSVQINLKNSVDVRREIDGMYCNKDGCMYIESKSGKQAKKPYELMKKDGVDKTRKSGIPRWSGGDTVELRIFCAPLTKTECAHALLKRDHPEFGKGLSEDSISKIEEGTRLNGGGGFDDLTQASKQAEILKDPNGVNPIRFSIDGFSPEFPCEKTPECWKVAEEVREEFGPDSMNDFIEMVDRSGDFADPSYGSLTSDHLFAMSGEFGFVEDDEEFSSVLWLVPSIVLFAIFSYIYFRKSRPKTPLTSVF